MKEKEELEREEARKNEMKKQLAYEQQQKDLRAQDEARALALQRKG